MYDDSVIQFNLGTNWARTMTSTHTCGWGALGGQTIKMSPCQGSKAKYNPRKYQRVTVQDKLMRLLLLLLLLRHVFSTGFRFSMFMFTNASSYDMLSITKIPYQFFKSCCRNARIRSDVSRVRPNSTNLFTTQSLHASISWTQHLCGLHPGQARALRHQLQVRLDLPLC